MVGVFPPHIGMKTMSENPENKPNTANEKSTPVPAEKGKSPTVEGELGEQELSKVSAGLVAVKSISWAHDDEG